ncbi:MAG: hypothetical protein HY420_03715 [Candidatus Kerfeldbacteria bacterium]|nr:hypothetical protein [Candidatus Kerfeldbacteria bacterium]
MKNIFLTSIVLSIVLVNAVNAATPFSIENFGGSVGLGTADLKSSVVNVVQWVLGILALAAVALLIVGFGDLLIAGDSDVVRTRAQRIIAGALIGLIVVLLAWAIVIFVAGTAANVIE